jgi:membrane peptidoglycan carboxypeptidase
MVRNEAWNVKKLSAPHVVNVVCQKFRFKNGGYKIVTTIDKNAQAAAEKHANPKDPDSPMSELKPNLGASIVAVQPGTGN